MKPGCLKLQITLKVIYRQEIENGYTKNSTQIYFNFKAQAAIYDLDIDDCPETSRQTILSKVQKGLDKASGRIIESIDFEYITISIYNSFPRDSYIQ